MREHYLVNLLDEGDESTHLFRDVDLSEKRRTGARIFASYQEGEV